MYKVFFNDNFLLLASKNENIAGIVIQSADPLIAWIQSFKESSFLNENRTFITEAPEKVLQDLLNFLPKIEAAGGLVRNIENKFLFIYRYAHWDLPKGKIEDNEKPEETAIREVEEETNISPLYIEKFLTHTYHIYLQHKQPVIKRTHWFLMQYYGNADPLPQITEHIIKANWMFMDDILKTNEPIFGTVREVLKAYK